MTLSNQILKFVENYCNTKFSTTSVTEIVEGGGEALVLKHAKIGTLTSVTDRFEDSVVDSSYYELDSERGMIFVSVNQSVTRWGRGVRRYSVVYTTGFAAVPADVQLVINQLEVAFTNNNPHLAGESLGDYSYSKKQLMHALSPELKTILDRYKNIVLL
jgi:hypothetical protein